MIDLFSGKHIEALFQMIQMKGSSRIIKFKSENIESALGYLQWHIRRYRKGLLLEISLMKKFYDWRTKTVRYEYE